MEKNGISERQKFGKNQGEDTTSSKILLKKHICHHPGQFSFSQCNLLKQNDKQSRQDMLDFKNKRKNYQKCQRESVSFKNQSSERPSGNTDFPFWHNTLHTVGASIHMN